MEVRDSDGIKSEKHAISSITWHDGSFTCRGFLRGSNPPELPRDPRRAGADPEKALWLGASRPRRGARLVSEDCRGPRDELRAYRRRDAVGDVSSRFSTNPFLGMHRVL